MSSVKRAVNFTNKEEAILVALVKNYQAIVESKKTHTVSNKKKNETWLQIAREFNSASGVAHRDVKILKNKYENIKKRTKKKAAQEKTAIFYTGGGPPENVPFTPVEEQIRNILGVRIDGLVSEFDDDALINEGVETDEVPIINVASISEDHDYVVQVVDDLDQNKVEGCAIEKNINNLADSRELSYSEEECVYTTESLDFASKDEHQKGDWSKATPKLLKTKKSLALQTPSGSYQRKREMGQKMEQWVMAKSESEQAKAKCMIEESELKMELMRKEHNKKMEIMELEYQARQKRETEEHTLRIELLKLKKKS